MNATKKACSQVATKKTGGRSNKSARRLQGVCRQVEAGVNIRTMENLKTSSKDQERMRNLRN